MAPPRPLQAHERVILTLFTIFIAVLVLAVARASYLAATTAGPRGIAQDAAGAVWVEFDDTFYVFSPDGRTLARHPIDAFGIVPPVAAMTSLPDGAMLVGSNTTGTLHVIRRDGTAGEVIDPATAGYGRLFGGFHLLVDPDTQHIFIADTSNHRILVLDRRGKLLRRIGSDNGQPGLLHFPNGLARTAKGELLVIDTNHLGLQRLNRELAPVSSITLRHPDRRFVWPALLAIDDTGNLYVSFMAHNMLEGSLAKLDANGKLLATFPLPAHARPWAFTVRRDDVLVADASRFTVERYGRQGEQLGMFGDLSFHHQLQTARESDRAWRLVVPGGQALLALTLTALLAVYAVARKKELARPLGEQWAVATEIPKPTAFQEVVIAQVWSVMYLSPAAMLLVVTDLLVHAAHLGARALAAHAAFSGLLLLAIFAVTLLVRYVFVSAAGSRWLQRALRAGAANLLRKCNPWLEGTLAQDERVVDYSLGILARMPALFVLSSDRILVLALNQWGGKLNRFQEVVRGDVLEPALASPSDHPWRWVFRFDFPATILSFRSRADGRRYALPFVDDRAAISFADAVRKDQLDARARRPASGVRDVAGAMPDERRGPDSVWKAAALSALYPGLGQLFNGEFADAIKCLVNFSYIVVRGLGPFLAWQGKIAEVPTEQLVFLALLALAVWILSVANAAWIARKAATKRWGLLPSERRRAG